MIIIILLYKHVIIDVGKIGDCNYWHQEVPRSSNHTGCRITVSLRCTIYRPCDIRVDVKWYRSSTEMDAEEDVIRDNGEYINSTSSNKYFIIPQIPVNNGNFENCCSTRFVLCIKNFNHSDSGYYWCQFVANHSRLLLPSPYGYISLSEGAGSNSQD